MWKLCTVPAPRYADPHTRSTAPTAAHSAAAPITTGAAAENGNSSSRLTCSASHSISETCGPNPAHALRDAVQGAQNPTTMMVALMSIRARNSILLAPIIHSPLAGVYHSHRSNHAPRGNQLPEAIWRGSGPAWLIDPGPI